MTSFQMVLIFTALTSSLLRAEGLDVPTGIAPYSSLDITQNFNSNVVSTTFNWDKKSKAQNIILRVKSSYGGLRHATITNSKVAYTITYNGTNGNTVSITTNNQTIGTRTIAKNEPSGSEVATSSINFAGVAANLLYQGVYSDTLTFTYSITSTGQTNNYTGVLTLTAIAIGSTLSFSLTPQSTASNLPLESNQTNLVVATAYETSNSATGYTLKVRSSNGGHLRHQNASSNPTPSQKIDYSAKYSDTIMQLSPANTDWTIKTIQSGIYNNSTSNISVSYAAPAIGFVVAGNYSDTLTFTITAQ